MANDYYPFGLSFNSYQRVTSKANKYNTFQDQEKITALDLNWIQFKWRNHDPTIGRFFNVDPLAEKYVYWTPYAFSGNQVIAHVELEGLEPVDFESAGKFFGEIGKGLKKYGQELLKIPEQIGRAVGQVLEENGPKADGPGPTLTSKNFNNTETNNREGPSTGESNVDALIGPVLRTDPFKTMNVVEKAATVSEVVDAVVQVADAVEELSGGDSNSENQNSEEEYKNDTVYVQYQGRREDVYIKKNKETGEIYSVDTVKVKEQ